MKSKRAPPVEDGKRAAKSLLLLGDLPCSRSSTSATLARRTFCCHREVSIRTLTVMAVATDFHRTFLTVKQDRALPHRAPGDAPLCFIVTKNKSS